MHTAPMADSQGEFAEFKTQEPPDLCPVCGNDWPGTNRPHISRPEGHN